MAQLTKRMAQKIWRDEVGATAAAWLHEFGETTPSPEWTEGAFSDISGAVIEALGLGDPWRAFHDAVVAQTSRAR